MLSPDCLRRSGDSCSYFCAQGYASSTIEKLLCTTEGVWNTDTTKLCSSKMSKTQYNGIQNHEYIITMLNMKEIKLIRITCMGSFYIFSIEICCT